MRVEAGRTRDSVVFSSIAPSPDLQEFVHDHLIAHFRFDPRAPIPHKRHAPKPEQGLTFFIRGRPCMVNPHTGEAHGAPPVAIFGQQTKRCDVHLAPEFLMFRVHFRPGALFRVLGVPLHELGEAYVDAEPVLGNQVRAVAERLATARSYAELLEVVEAYLVRTVLRKARRLLPVDRAAAHVLAHPPQMSVDRLARDACLSPRQLRRKFIERIGVGPKLYGRLVRFHGAYRFKLAHPEMAWPSVALAFGYTDYQHMVRDFREFTNATPTAWLAEDHRSPEHALRDGLLGTAAPGPLTPPAGEDPRPASRGPQRPVPPPPASAAGSSRTPP